MDIDITRYDLYAENSHDYEGEVIGTYLEIVESTHGEWAYHEDVLPLLGRITFLENRVKDLEAANRSLRYNQADDYFEPMGKFSGDY